jgi:hypothetical protein
MTLCDTFNKGKVYKHIRIKSGPLKNTTTHILLNQLIPFQQRSKHIEIQPIQASTAQFGLAKLVCIIKNKRQQ